MWKKNKTYSSSAQITGVRIPIIELEHRDFKFFSFVPLKLSIHGIQDELSGDVLLAVHGDILLKKILCNIKF